LSFYKMEVLSRKPPIIAYHDVISRRDANLVVSIAEDEVRLKLTKDLLLLICLIESLC
jgi:hypothetical protein